MKLVKTVLPFLDGINYSRICFFNRMIFHCWFAFSLITISKIFSGKKFRVITSLIACAQIAAVLSFSGIYGYSYLNLNRNELLQNGPSNHCMTFREFYSENLFDEIKADLKYNGEGVAALGYHPGVLIYNGFSTIDGYNNFYPLKRALEFREIIEPQLNRNAKHKEYYDS